MEQQSSQERQTLVSGLPRMIAALVLAGCLAPVLFMGLYVLAAAITAGTRVPSSGGSSDWIGEVVGFTLVALILGGPASIGSAVLVGLPGIWLARRLGLNSVLIFSIGGSLVALGCTAWFERGDVPGRIAEWTGFAATAMLTGALCGALCWLVAERPRRTIVKKADP